VTKSKVISRLVELQPPILDAWLAERSRCILATAIGIDVLRHFDIDARPVSVQMDLWNKPWVDWVRAGKPGEGTITAVLDLERRGGYMLSAGDSSVPVPGGLQPGRWDGHLMVEVPGPTALLIDLDLQQFRRPAKGFNLPAAVVFHLTDPQGAEFTIPGGGKLRIETKRHDQSFTAAPDWNSQAKRQAVVKEVIRAIRSWGR
jgi:hypothetical protein